VVLAAVLPAFLFSFLSEFFLGLPSAALGTTLRAIGRGLGNGILDFSEASAAPADSCTASASVVAIAVERIATSRANWVTALLCDESRDGGGPDSISLNMRKNTNHVGRLRCLRHHHGKIAAPVAY
jgi:hypothetical protein